VKVCNQLQNWEDGMKLKLKDMVTRTPTSSTSVTPDEHPEWLPPASAGHPATREYHRWTDSIEVLQKIYLEELGVATRSTNRKFLLWRIRQARRGRIPEEHRQPGPDCRKRVVINLTVAELAELDQQVQTSGESRSAYVRSRLFPGHT
jgi:hypothetical protein